MVFILKSTVKGQVTLPAQWRKKFKTDRFVATVRGNKIEIEPLFLEKNKPSKEVTVFDALRDNRGKGIKAKDLVKILKEIGN